MSAPLRWEKASENGWFAFRGRHVVGMAVQVTQVPETNALYRKWAYKLDAVQTRHVTSNGHGHVGSLASAKRAVQRAWDDWCDAFEMKGREE